MPICEDCNNFINSGNLCLSCYQKLIRKAKKEVKKIYSEKKEIKNQNNNLKNKLQNVVSHKMKAYYKENGLYKCWITGKTTFQKGLFSLHASHYFAKSECWQLWNCPINVYLSTYNENVNKPYNVAAVTAMIVKVWGEHYYQKLLEANDYYNNRRKLGIIRSKPTELELKALIKETQILSIEELIKKTLNII